MTGDELRRALNDLGMSQAEFAELAGDHPSTVSNRVRSVKGYPIPKHVETIIALLRRVRDLEDRFAEQNLSA
jgi:transcriptional regulator with XRE-family HTH domain